MEPAAIGIFDSGLGGLTVAREVAAVLPGESLVYLGDTARCPYGPRDLAEVRRFVLEIGSWLEGRAVKLIIIACNTATAAGLALAQQTFSVPVIGVVEPGARAAVMATNNRRVGVIGTVGTIESGAYSTAVRAIDAGVTVFSAATPRFVDIVEEGLRRDSGRIEDMLAHASEVFIRPSFYEIARDYLDPLKRTGVDTLVLGCTHFPLLSAAIGQAMGSSVRIISSAEETALEVAETLRRRGALAAPGSGVSRAFVTTGDEREFERLGSRVFGAPLGAVERITLEELADFVSPEAMRRAAVYEGEPTCA
ncbi:MAG: glutamate racemase [Coriobacteriia bacterium]|nr:glutamate racemase [Coriobacteriia bacterium]